MLLGACRNSRGSTCSTSEAGFHGRVGGRVVGRDAICSAIRSPVGRRKVERGFLAPGTFSQARKVCVCVCVFITAGPSTKLFAWGGGILEDMCHERRRAEACVD